MKNHRLILKYCDGTRITLVLPKKATLRQLVSIYRKHCAAELLFKLQSFEALPLDQAIKMAAQGKEAYGKHIDHLRRALTASLRKASRRLPRKISEENFDTIYTLVAKKVKHLSTLKEMYFYDVALRIAVSKGLWPGKVYLQCGALEGARNLFDTWNPKKKTEPKVKLMEPEKKDKLLSFEYSDFPSEMHCLNAAEIEDFLCIFKDHLDFTNKA